MEVFYVIGGLIMFLILWIFFIPVCLRIDTDLDRYEVTQAGTLNISFSPHEERRVRLKIFGCNVRISGKKKIRPRTAAKKSRPAIKRSTATWIFLMKGIKKSFRLRKLVWTMDLDDVVLNARMVPILFFLNTDTVSLNTNFSDRFYFRLEIDARVNKMLWTFFIFYLRK
ncbi:MAG TPA: hypothetical protein VIQ51_14685, partial [Chryseosolibacter sp.]